jgi:hypothetical protein
MIALQCPRNYSQLPRLVGFIIQREFDEGAKSLLAQRESSDLAAFWRHFAPLQYRLNPELFEGGRVPSAYPPLNNSGFWVLSCTSRYYKDL